MDLARPTAKTRASWLPWRRGAARTPEPGAALFRGLRLRLTLWYSGVLVLALLACGLVLYFGLRDLTLSPVRTSMESLARFGTQEWLRNPPKICGEPGSGRPPPPRRGPVPFYMACISPDGQLIGSFGGSPQTGGVPSAFLSTSLVADALRTGSADDIVDADDELSPIYRLAVLVPDPATGSPLGVVQVGQSIATQWDTLLLLRNLLILIAVMALLGSVALGLILAERALEPARLAFGRQQAFIGDASHQLRTPLTLLRADAEVLLRHRDRFAAEDAELLEDIVAESADMDQLATNLLTLARLDAGRLHLEHDVVDLGELASDVARRVGALAGEKRLHLAADFAAQPRLVGDRQALEQAALILVENAIKYTPVGGSITLRTAAPDGRADFTVEDTGVGIPPEHLERLGERFYRVDPARTPAPGGAGLGLANAFGIAAAHGGDLKITSTPGQGTRATLSVPVAGPTGA
jgi:signal transduction histidine kinase